MDFVLSHRSEYDQPSFSHQGLRTISAFDVGSFGRGQGWLDLWTAS